MATTKEYLGYVLEQFSDIEGVAHRAMMGEYVLYYKDKVIGGIYDNRVLLKPVEAVKKLIPDAQYELPYEGAKEMIMADIEDRELLKRLLISMYDELPARKVKKAKKQ